MDLHEFVMEFSREFSREDWESRPFVASARDERTLGIPFQRRVLTRLLKETSIKADRVSALIDADHQGTEERWALLRALQRREAELRLRLHLLKEEEEWAPPTPSEIAAAARAAAKFWG